MTKSHTLEGRFTLRGNLGLWLTAITILGLVSMRYAPWQPVRFFSFPVVLICFTLLNAGRLPLWEEKEAPRTSDTSD